MTSEKTRFVALFNSVTHMSLEELPEALAHEHILIRTLALERMQQLNCKRGQEEEERRQVKCSL